MDTLPSDVLERICGRDRRMTGRIRQVCGAFQQIRGDWDVLYRAYVSGVPNPNRLVDVNGIITLECSSFHLIGVESMIFGGIRHTSRILSHAPSARYLIATEYIRMLQSDRLVLVFMRTCGIDYFPCETIVRYRLDMPDTRRLPTSCYCFGFLPAYLVHNFDYSKHDLKTHFSLT